MSKVDSSGYTIALGMQGGGALGSYQGGVYRGMKERGYEPSVLAGISIGAINAAVLAGNEPEQRLAKVQGFWKAISRPQIPMFVPTLPLRVWSHYLGMWDAVVRGQPNFFDPRFIPPWLALPGTPEATSFCDTAKLRQTLLKFVDFDLINDKSRPNRTRLIVGAVEVETADMVWFDNFEQEKITPEHIMASGALPPGFPGVRIDGKLYWDGGCHSNTVLDVLLERVRHVDLHIFLPTLFGPTGPEPRTIDEVLRRMKEIQFGAHARKHVKRAQESHDLRVALDTVLRQLPPEMQAQLEELWPHGRCHDLRVTHVELKAPDYETAGNDIDFSEDSLSRREFEGYEDVLSAIGQIA